MHSLRPKRPHFTRTDLESPTCLRDRYPFMDDTCPPLESVVDFCENAKAWLDAHEDNVVSLHCKAGKGRAGIMAACLMVRMGETAQAALTSFDAVRRSGRGKGGRHYKCCWPPLVRLMVNVSLEFLRLESHFPRMIFQPGNSGLGPPLREVENVIGNQSDVNRSSYG